MRWFLTLTVALGVLTGCASAASVPAATAPATSAPAPARSCAAATTYDSAGRFVWSGTTYTPLGQTALTDKDTAGLLFAVGCDGAKGYGLRGMRSTCEVVVLNTDAWDAYAPSPLPSGCPAPVTSSGGRIAALPTSLADCPLLPSQPVGQVTLEDFGDTVVDADTTFVAQGKPTTATPGGVGAVQFTVRCSYNELNTVTHQSTPELRSHDATFVPAGNPVYAMNGWPPSCRLAAQHDGAWHVYLALDPQAGPGTFKACASGDSPPSQEPLATRTTPAKVTGTFASCPSPSPTRSASTTIVASAACLDVPPGD